MKETITPPDRSSVNDPLIVHCRGEGRNPNEIYRSRSHRKNKKRHRRHGTVSKGLLLVAIIALLGGSGFGISKYLDGSNTPNTADGGSALKADSNVITTAENTVVISGESIYYAGEKIDAAETLKSRVFADYNEGETFIIKDDKAIKDTYDSVINMFREISVPYIEE